MLTIDSKCALHGVRLHFAPSQLFNIVVHIIKVGLLRKVEYGREAQHTTRTYLITGISCNGIRESGI